MKNKNFTLDDNGKVRKTIGNILKMNPFEYCYYDIFHWSYFKYEISDIWNLLKKIINDILSIFGILITTLFMPIFAWMMIKDYRKQWRNK